MAHGLPKGPKFGHIVGVVVNRREALKLEGGHSLAGHFARSPNEFAGLLTTE